MASEKPTIFARRASRLSVSVSSPTTPAAVLVRFVIEKLQAEAEPEIRAAGSDRREHGVVEPLRGEARARVAERAGFSPPESKPDKRARRLICALGDIDAL